MTLASVRAHAVVRLGVHPSALGRSLDGTKRGPLERERDDERGPLANDGLGRKSSSVLVDHELDETERERVLGVLGVERTSRRTNSPS